MINFLNNIFTKEKKSQSKYETIETNKIELSLDKSKEPQIKISIIDTTGEDAKIFASMLHNMLSGLYTDSLFDILISLAKDDKTIKKFINQVLVHYSLLQTQKVLDSSKKTSSTPLIKPTQFNKL